MNPLRPAYIIDTSLLSPVGLTVPQNFESVLQQKSGIREIDDIRFFPKPTLASLIGEDIMLEFKQKFKTISRFDSLLLACINDIQKKQIVDFSEAETGIILSTTKGNVEIITPEKYRDEILLSYSAGLIQKFLNNPNPVTIISNACISGLSASIVAQRMLHTGKFKNVLVVGCDVVSKFVLSGFQSFKAISKSGCRPFDLHRDGLVLGEACGAILFSQQIESNVVLSGGCISNDANHISGPSKTGEELAHCIQQTLSQSSTDPLDIDFVSAHGTSTVYNDEMESKAIDIAGIHRAPVFSVKANYGHTLGAAGVLETIISAECLKHNIIPGSMGFEQKGVSGKINVSTKLQGRENRIALKTASGFGGCNAAVLLKKV